MFVELGVLVFALIVLVLGLIFTLVLMCNAADCFVGWLLGDLGVVGFWALDIWVLGVGFWAAFGCLGLVVALFDYA